MKKTRQRYDRAFKISVVAELECGKPSAQIVHEHGLHPSLPSQWRDEWLTVLKKWTVPTE